MRTDDGRVAASTAVSCGEMPLRTAEGEFDVAELMTSVGETDTSVSEPAVVPVP